MAISERARMQDRINQLRSAMMKLGGIAPSGYLRGYMDCLVGMEHLIKQLDEEAARRPESDDHTTTVTIHRRHLVDLHSADGITDVQSLHLVRWSGGSQRLLIIRPKAPDPSPTAGEGEAIRRAVRAMLGNMRKQVESLRQQAIAHDGHGFAALGDVLRWLDRQDDAHAEAAYEADAPVPNVAPDKVAPPAEAKGEPTWCVQLLRQGVHVRTCHDILGGTEHDTKERDCQVCKGTGRRQEPTR